MANRYHWRNVRGIFKANDGISAVEFALIAPLMFLIYFGCIELSFMMTLDRKVTTSAATLGDLTARAATIDDAELAEIIQATRMVMQPSDITKAKMRVSSLLEEDGKVTVVWSNSCGGMSEWADGREVTVPADLMPAGSTLIMAEFEYPYASPIGFFIQSEKTLKETFYLRPRRVDSITRDEVSASVACGYSWGS